MATYTYMEAIGQGFPGVECHAAGDGILYEEITWDAGNPMPSKETLDAWIANNPKPERIQLTKYEFRKLFSLMERVAIDNAPTNPAIPLQYRMMLVTMQKDLELSGVVELDNPDVAAGMGMLEQLGLIAHGRGAQILANMPPG